MLFVALFPGGCANPENDTREAEIRFQKATIKYRAERHPQNLHAIFRQKKETHFCRKLHLVNFAMARPTDFKIGGGARGAPPEEVFNNIQRETVSDLQNFQSEQIRCY